MSYIKIEVPNDDHIALRAFGKALEEMALAHGAEPVAETLVRQRAGDVEVEYLTRNAVAAKCGLTIEELDNVVTKAEVDTTAQQVESLAVPVEANGATYETDLGSDNPQPVPVADSTGTPWDERIHSASKALNADGTWRLRRKPKDMDESQWSKYVEAVKADTTSADDDSWDTDRRPGSGGNGGVGVGESDEIEPPVTPQYDGEQQPINLNHVSIDPSHEKGDETAELTIEPRVTPPGDDFHTDAGVVTEQTVAGIPPIPVPPPVALPGSTGATDLLPPPPVGTPVTQPTWDFPKLMKFLTERHGKIDVTTVNSLLAADGIASLQELNGNPDKISPFVARVKAHLGE